ncbi:MAG: hypothetical protein HY392_03860 [Candidatus Diapherotrites archaeon]|nr:hypothetical protein [Candidatus Diapherotrites archaeon]
MSRAFRRRVRRQLAKVTPGFARKPIFNAHVWLLRKKQAMRLKSEIRELRKKLERENLLRGQELALLRSAADGSRRIYPGYVRGDSGEYLSLRRTKFDLAAAQKNSAEYIAELSAQLEGKQERLGALLARFRKGK